MKHALLLLALAGLAALVQEPAQAQQGDERIIAAREALRTGKREQLDALAARREGHVLDAYVQFWRLSNVLARRDQAAQARDLEEFLGAEHGSLLAERLRARWIERLAEDGDWQAVSARFAQLLAPELDSRCHALNARLMLGERDVLADARALWDETELSTDACQPVVTALLAAGRIDSEELWWRFRRAMEGGRLAAALRVARWLPDPDAPDEKAVRELLDKPARHLDRLPVNFAISRSGRELALAALARVARDDAAHAHFRFQRVVDRLKAGERGYAFAVLGWRAAEQHLPAALDWYRAAGEIPMSAEQYDWHARAALRVEDWPALQRAIEAMPEARRNMPVWVYWHGRALRAQGDEAGAVYEFARIADGIDFYELLAIEELGGGFAPRAADRALREAARTRVEQDPGLRRALALFALDLRAEAVREWNWALRGRDDAFLVAAAGLAAERGLYDRAINTAELARAGRDLELSYLAPYRELVEPQANARGLDLSWVYGLMRQESRFVPAARSSAGAQGLMQVMPATGRWVAKKQGISGYSLPWLREPENNVMIGTAYMRMILDDLDNHPLLASAGYNAGPGRARRWRDGRPLEGAIYAETIPFDETRQYVKKVMANAVVYDALFNGRAQSLKARLGTIGPGPK